MQKFKRTLKLVRGRQKMSLGRVTSSYRTGNYDGGHCRSKSIELISRALNLDFDGTFLVIN